MTDYRTNARGVDFGSVPDGDYLISIKNGIFNGLQTFDTLENELHSLGPVGEWRFNGDATDSSGNGYNLTISSSAYVNSLIPSAPGSNKAINQNTNLYGYSAASPAKIDAISGVMSVAWIGRWTDPANNGHVCGQLNAAGTADHFSLAIGPGNGSITLSWYSGGSLRTHFFDGLAGVTPTGRAYIGTIIADGTRVYLYINGEFVDFVDQIGGPVAQPASGKYVVIGANSATNQRWLGHLDTVAIFDKALTKAQAKRLALAAGFKI